MYNYNNWLYFLKSKFLISTEHLREVNLMHDFNDELSSIRFFSFNFIKFRVENADSQVYMLSSNNKILKKTSVMLEIFFGNIVSKTFQNTNLF